MNLITKPMLASKAESLESVKFPVYASPKLDGIRCLTIPSDTDDDAMSTQYVTGDGVSAVTRNWKPIPNNHIRTWLEANVPAGFDGELMVDGAFNEVSSAIMAEDGEPNFYYNVFDYVKEDISTPFTRRLSELRAAAMLIPGNHIRVVPQVLINNPIELKAFLDKCIEDGFEGAMIRSPSSPYKCGRSTEREGYLLKLKLFDDSEAIIEGSYVLMHNDNEATLDAFGRTERSQKKEGLVETDKLGGFHVRDLKTGIGFDIGTGYNDNQRREFLANRDKMVGKIIKYKYQGTTLEKPRFPVFLGFRDLRDM